MTGHVPSKSLNSFSQYFTRTVFGHLYSEELMEVGMLMRCMPYRPLKERHRIIDWAMNSIQL
jgi:hypothetical protein